MAFSAEEITKLIREQIKNYEHRLKTDEVGTVILVGDGVARVSGLDLTVRNTRDGGTIWEDSCCEIFLQAPGCDTYYNIEVNAAGILLVGRGTGRGDRVLLPPEEMARITRKADVKAPVDIPNQVCTWSLTVAIPFQVIGLDPAHLPGKLLGNIYKCGDKTPHPHFLSWSPIDTPAPDFHRPEFFGEFLLG